MLKGFRTFIVAAVVAVIGVAEAFDWTALIPDQYEALALPVVAALFAYLRSVTSTPAGKSV